MSGRLYQKKGREGWKEGDEIFHTDGSGVAALTRRYRSGRRRYFGNSKGLIISNFPLPLSPSRRRIRAK